MKFLSCCHKMEPNKACVCKLLIAYGTQTGQSKSIAEELKRKASDQGYDTEMLSLDDSVEKMPWINYRFVVIITSSTGDGDPPENAEKFWRKIRSKDLNAEYLSQVEYALLGLGDTNYTTFLGFPKAVEKQLKKLGAKQFYKSGWADDAVGLENVVDPWIENLWPALTNQLLAPDTLMLVQSSEPANSNSDPPAVSKVLTPEVSATKADEPADKVNEEEIKECLDGMATLTVSITPLNESNLKIPLLPESYLELKFDPSLPTTDSESERFKLPLPSARSQIFPAKVKDIRELTSKDALKTTLEVTLDWTGTDLVYDPGDAIGVYCTNDPDEVETLLSRLGMQDKADVPYVLGILESVAGPKSGAKPKHTIPSHLPTSATLRFVLTHCCEIRSVPRKALLRVLAEFTSSAKEKRRLLELCSAQGSDDYTQLIREPNVNVLDVLNAFPSCQPPIERLLEHWPRLLARPYSLSSSPLVDPNSAVFLFNVVEFPLSNGRTYERRGVATGGFQRMFSSFNASSGGDDISLSVYLRTNNGFRLPQDPATPMILIGPGTGVAPFLGFLVHREQLLKSDPSRQFGPVWLLYGCRSKEQDYLYRTALENWHSTGILTRLFVCFSRSGDPSQPKYVQDIVRIHQIGLVKLIGKGACIYVCGDAKNMAKDVMEAITNAIQTVKDVDEQEAKKCVLQLQKEKRYLQDIWT